MGQLAESRRLLTVGGVETYLIFIQNVELRQFCGFDIFAQEEELARLEDDSLTPTADAALRGGWDLLLDTLTWRAHGEYARALGHDGPDGVERLNAMAVSRMRDFARRWRASTPDAEQIDVFINGDIGPRGDGYVLGDAMAAETAYGYHRRQVEALAAAGVDAISALTMTSVAEAVGIARAARETDVPCIISPTVETDGRTPDGRTLGQFIEAVEDATDGSPLFYMVNCAHPVHVEAALEGARARGEGWLARFAGFRANASRKSHAELDESTELDRGEPRALGEQMARLRTEYDLRLVGGCCGTDHEHIAHIARAASPQRALDGEPLQGVPL